MSKILTGSEAAAIAIGLCKPKVIAAYPITPQTHIIEKLALMVSEKRLKARYICTDSELSSIGVAAGAVAEGVRAFTATSSHGLALMHEGLHWVAGGRLPVVMVVATRGLGAPWILTCDHQDALSQRDTGWMMAFASSAQEIHDLIPLAYRVAESVSIPCMVCMDGFLISHTAEPVEILTEESVGRLLPDFSPILHLSDDPFTLWPVSDPETYYKARRDLFEDHKRALSLWKEAFGLLKRETGRGYSPCETFETEDARVIIAATGAVWPMAKEAAIKLRKKGERIGAVGVRLIRPFPEEDLREAFRNAEKIVVLDKSLSAGRMGILGQEIASCTDIPVVNLIASMGGKEFGIEEIEWATKEKEGVIWLS